MPAPCVTCDRARRCPDVNVCPTLDRYARQVAGSCKECGSTNIDTYVENGAVRVHCNDCDEFYDFLLDGVDY